MLDAECFPHFTPQVLFIIHLENFNIFTNSICTGPRKGGHHELENSKHSYGALKANCAGNILMFAHTTLASRSTRVSEHKSPIPAIRCRTILICHQIQNHSIIIIFSIFQVKVCSLLEEHNPIEVIVMLLKVH